MSYDSWKRSFLKSRVIRVQPWLRAAFRQMQSVQNLTLIEISSVYVVSVYLRGYLARYLSKRPVFFRALIEKDSAVIECDETSSSLIKALGGEMIHSR